MSLLKLSNSRSTSFTLSTLLRSLSRMSASFANRPSSNAFSASSWSSATVQPGPREESMALIERIAVTQTGETGAQRACEARVLVFGTVYIDYQQTC